MKTKLKTRPSSLVADGSLNLHVPHSWGEMTQQQLRYALTLLTEGWEEWQIRTYLFARFADIKVLNEKKDGWLCETETDKGKTVRFYLQLWEVQGFCEVFDYVFDGKGADNRLDHIGKWKAVDLELHGVPLIDYIVCDNYFQQFMQNDWGESDEPIRQMASILYPTRKGDRSGADKGTKAEIMGVFLWFVWIKSQFSTLFPHLFKPAGSGGNYDMIEAMNAQIRALTGGDITKEETIKQADVWRALTELDAKAREAEEMDEKLKQKS